MESSRDEIYKALEQVIDPELRRPVTELDMVRDIHIDGGDVAITIALTVAGCPLRASFEDQVRRWVAPLEGVETVSLAFDVMSPDEKTALTAKLRGGIEERTKGISLDKDTRVLAIASGKGGVGKSSLTANLAAAFARMGRRTGVLDADVYGHSIPHMLGIRQRPVVVDKMIVPPVKGDLNILLVDMPPGTGDVAISLGQLLPRAEAIVVTTPQPAAQEVAVRAALMAQKTNMRLIGVIENMAGDVFGTGGGRRLAAELEIALLGTIPLDPRLRECGDSGEPLVWSDPESETAQLIARIAEAIDETKREQGVGIVKALPVLS